MNIQWNTVTWYSKLATVIFFVGILPAWTFYLGTQYEQVAKALSIQPASPDFCPHSSSTFKICRFFVGATSLEVEGNNLSKVEIWDVPTGTQITASDLQKLGDATKNGSTWTFSLTQCPLSTGIFARGFDQQNKPLEDVYLPFGGATDIYYNVCQKLGIPDPLAR